MKRKFAGLSVGLRLCVVLLCMSMLLTGCFNRVLENYLQSVSENNSPENGLFGENIGDFDDTSDVIDMRGEFANPNTMGNTSANISNGGFVTEQNGWIYFSTKNDIRRMDESNIDPINAEVIYSGGKAKYLNVIGKDMFFSKGSSLMHLDLSTGEYEEIEEIPYDSCILAENGKLYYTAEQNVSASQKQYSLMEKDIENLTEPGRVIAVMDNYIGYIYGILENGLMPDGTANELIYFSSPGSQEGILCLWASDLTGTGNKFKIDIAGMSSANISYGDIMDYFIQDGRLYAHWGRVPINTHYSSSFLVYDLTTGEIISDFVSDQIPACYCFNYADGALVVGVSGNGLAADLQPSSDMARFINEDEAYQICIAKDYIFYRVGLFEESWHMVNIDGTGYQQIC